MSDACCGDTGGTGDEMNEVNDSDVKAAIREMYSKVAEGSQSCCGGGEMLTGAASIAHLPAEVIDSNAGSGNPIDAAGLREGETVLDLGSGAGLDCFLAAEEVGPSGRVIGLDMTDAMLAKAEAGRKKLGLGQVEFRKGELEEMPLEDASVDTIISNCVVNLSPDKASVFRESHRVLRPGGRFVVSDVIKGAGFVPSGTSEEWCECIAGAISEEEYLGGLRAAGFESAEIISRAPYLVEGLQSAIVRGVKAAG
jgi:SAM-dependent methyltransferase